MGVALPPQMNSLRRCAFRLLALLPVALVSAAACGGKSFNADGGDGSGTAGAAFAGSGATSSAGSSNGGGGSTNGGTANGGTGGGRIDACVENTDCVLEPASCCSCGGGGPITDYTAINSKYVDQYNSKCSGIACGPCPPIAYDPNDPRLYYVPTCVSGITVGDKVFHQCRAVDIRNTDDITSCKTDADCTLRSGTACCQECVTQAVAINSSKEAKLESLVCPSQAFGCAGCAPNPDGLGAKCVSGQCGVQSTPCTLQHPCL